MIVLALVLTFSGPVDHVSYLWRTNFRDSSSCQAAAQRTIEYAGTRVPKGTTIEASYSCEKSEVLGI